MPDQGRSQCCIIGLDRSAARHDDQVYTCQPRPVVAKHLAYQALESISVNRAPNLFTGYGQPHPGLIPLARYCENGEIGISRALRMRENPLEIGGRQQARRSGETAVGYQRGSGNRSA